jgi:hypothetical protein
LYFPRLCLLLVKLPPFFLLSLICDFLFSWQSEICNCIMLSHFLLLAGKFEPTSWRNCVVVCVLTVCREKDIWVSQCMRETETQCVCVCVCVCVCDHAFLRWLYSALIQGFWFGGCEDVAAISRFFLRSCFCFGNGVSEVFRVSGKHG